MSVYCEDYSWREILRRGCGWRGTREVVGVIVSWKVLLLVRPVEQGAPGGEKHACRGSAHAFELFWPGELSGEWQNW